MHQYCMCSVRTWGSGTGFFGAAVSYLRCSGRSKYHFDSIFSKRCSSWCRNDGGLIAYKHCMIMLRMIDSFADSLKHEMI